MHTPRRKSPTFYPVVILAASSLLAPTVLAQLCAAPDNAPIAPLVNTTESSSLTSFGSMSASDGTPSQLRAVLPVPRSGGQPTAVIPAAPAANVNAPTRQTLSTSALIELATDSVPQTSYSGASEEPAGSTLVAAIDIGSPQAVAHVRSTE